MMRAILDDLLASADAGEPASFATLQALEELTESLEAITAELEELGVTETAADLRHLIDIDEE